MKVQVKLTLFALVATPLVGAAADESNLSCIKDFTYSQDFLDRHPKAGAACREVIMKDGQKWARFDARLVKLKGDQVTVDFLDTSREPLETMTFIVSPDARVVVNGKKVSYDALERGETLSFWLPEGKIGFYAAPGAAQFKEIKVAEVESP